MRILLISMFYLLIGLYGSMACFCIYMLFKTLSETVGYKNTNLMMDESLRSSLGDGYSSCYDRESDRVCTGGPR